MDGCRGEFNRFGDVKKSHAAWLERWPDSETQNKLPPPPSAQQVQQRCAKGTACKVVFPGDHGVLKSVIAGNAFSRETARYVAGEVVDYDLQGRMIWKALEFSDLYGVTPFDLHRIDLSKVSQRRRIGCAHSTIMRHKVDGLFQEEDPEADKDCSDVLEKMAERNGGAMELMKKLLAHTAQQHFDLLLHDEARRNRKRKRGAGSDGHDDDEDDDDGGGGEKDVKQELEPPPMPAVKEEY